jgi:hypothetical protein
MFLTLGLIAVAWTALTIVAVALSAAASRGKSASDVLYGPSGAARDYLPAAFQQSSTATVAATPSAGRQAA